jgi:hypothetical protein
MKKIVLIASGTAEKETIKWKDKLEADGFEVLTCPLKIEDGKNFLKEYQKSFNLCYSSIPITDVVLAINIEKNGVKGYIGPGTFAEIAFAIGINRTRNKNIEIYYLNDLPTQGLPYCEELSWWKELGWIKKIKL